MAPLDVEAQFKFLIACIKNSNAGKIDFDNVAKECDIISKGAAAKRYERLMKAHGITGNTGGGGAAGAGPSTPKTPKTPAGGRKTQPGSSRASSSKKRKLAATSNDVDDDDMIKNEVKDEVKDEVKQEAADNNSGSYSMHPTDTHFDAAMVENFVKACYGGGGKTLNLGGNFQGLVGGAEDEIFVVAEGTCRDHNGPSEVPVAAPPVALVQQMFVPAQPPNEGFYAFVDHHHSSHHLPQPPPTQQQQTPSHAAAIAMTSAPPLPHHDHDTNCLPQARMMTSEHSSTAQWLHQQSIYWNGESPAEIGGSLDWGH